MAIKVMPSVRAGGGVHYLANDLSARDHDDRRQGPLEWRRISEMFRWRKKLKGGTSDSRLDDDGGEEERMSVNMGSQTDTTLLNWLERRWRRDEEPPVDADDEGFHPNTTGMWPRKMTLRQAIKAAMDPRAGKARLEKHFSKKKAGREKKLSPAETE
ncbi:MAG: hypothetical protein QM757_26630 [Paludibaculum sp.]